MTKNSKTSRDLAMFLFEIGTLRKIVRAHRQALLTDDLSDNIASHSFRVALIGWSLAKLEGVNPYKVVMMCLLHDLGESRSGDQNWINKKFVKVFDQEIGRAQLSRLPDSAEAMNLLAEYEARKSTAAKVAKDADLVDQILLLKEYEWQGNQEAARWLQGSHKIKALKTQSAKRVAREIMIQRPSNWWDGSSTSKRR